MSVSRQEGDWRECVSGAEITGDRERDGKQKGGLRVQVSKMHER